MVRPVGARLSEATKPSGLNLLGLAGTASPAAGSVFVATKPKLLDETAVVANMQRVGALIDRVEELLESAQLATDTTPLPPAENRRGEAARAMWLFVLFQGIGIALSACGQGDLGAFFMGIAGCIPVMYVFIGDM